MFPMRRFARLGSKFQLRQYSSGKVPAPEAPNSSRTHNKLNKSFSPEDLAKFRAAFVSLEQKWGFTSREQWYQIEYESIKHEDTDQIVSKRFSGSLPQALMTIFADHEWQPWLFPRMPRGLWADKTLQKRYFNWLKVRLNIGDDLERWYNVSTDDIIENHGVQLIQRVYNHSFLAALRDVYPHHQWLPWKFAAAPKSYWESEDARKDFFLWLSGILGINDEHGTPRLERWYRVSHSTVVKHGGAAALRKYDNTLAGALMALFPEHKWEPWKFETVPLYWWRNISNQRRFFEAIRPQLGVQTMEDWYTVSGIAVQALGANGLMPRYYRGSIARALMTIYPEHTWDPWRFSRVSLDSWNSLLSSKSPQVTANYARRYLDTIADQLKINRPEQWSLVREEDIKRLKAAKIPLSSFGGLRKALELAYPEHFGDQADNSTTKPN